MIYINKNNLRINAIKEFIDTYDKYQSSNDDQNLRNVISRRTPEIASYVRDIGVGTVVNDLQVGRYDLFENISQSHLSSPDKITDRLYSALGAYEYRQKTFKRKLINPLYWVGEFIRLPFHILRYAGFNASKIELSWFGRIYKLIATFVIFLAAVLQILNMLGINTTFFSNLSK